MLLRLMGFAECCCRVPNPRRPNTVRFIGTDAVPRMVDVVERGGLVVLAE